jgi:copper chaperone CopZ
MKSKKVKHSKYKNTGVLFELLVRQITNDTLNGIKNSPAIKIIEQFFNKKTNIRKEIQLYHTLQNQKFNTEDKANRFIDVVIKEYSKVNKSTLRTEKYNLIKEIKRNYVLESFFKTKISNYKLNASIAKTLDKEYTNPADKVRSRYTIVEEIVGSKVIKSKQREDKVLKEYAADADLRVLSYKILLEKFNSKYGKLGKSQRNLLREYINNVSNSEKLKSHTDNEVTKITNAISKLKPTVSDKIVKIKLEEVKSQLQKIQEDKKVKDIHLVSLLRSYDLIKELKNVSK